MVAQSSAAACFSPDLAVSGRGSLICEQQILMWTGYGISWHLDKEQELFQRQRTHWKISVTSSAGMGEQKRSVAIPGRVVSSLLSTLPTLPAFSLTLRVFLQLNVSLVLQYPFSCQGRGVGSQLLLFIYSLIHLGVLCLQSSRRFHSAIIFLHFFLIHAVA